MNDADYDRLAKLARLHILKIKLLNLNGYSSYIFINYKYPVHGDIFKAKYNIEAVRDYASVCGNDDMSSFFL